MEGQNPAVSLPKAREPIKIGEAEKNVLIAGSTKSEDEKLPKTEESEKKTLTPNPLPKDGKESRTPVPHPVLALDNKASADKKAEPKSTPSPPPKNDVPLSSAPSGGKGLKKVETPITTTLPPKPSPTITIDDDLPKVNSILNPPIPTTTVTPVTKTAGITAIPITTKAPIAEPIKKPEPIKTSTVTTPIPSPAVKPLSTANTTVKIPHIWRGLPCEREYDDDLENFGAELADDTDILEAIRESNKIVLDEVKRHKGETKGPLRSHVLVYKGDITRIGTDAIVNAANEPCSRGGGIDGAIHEACLMDTLQNRINDKLKAKPGESRCPIGTARVISVANFPEKRTLHENTRFILQAVGPIGENESMVRSAYLSSLMNAEKLGIRHVALNCISTGIFGYKPENAAPVAISTVQKWLLANPQSKLIVVFVLFDGDYEKQHPLYYKLMDEIFPFTE